MDAIKRIAILTGATGGLGYAFMKELSRESVDEIWAIGRNAENLEALEKEFGERVVPFRLDLTKAEDITALDDALKTQNPQIAYLINNAGIAQFKPTTDLSIAEINGTVDLNCKVPMILSNLCIPYMQKGSRIVNICSASAFQPVPYINLYASTKAFDRSYSRALNMELKPRGITVTAVCPSWIDTNLLPKEINGKKVKFSGIVAPESVAKTAMKDAKRGKDMSVCSLYVKCQHLNVKLMPQKWTMRIWFSLIKKYF